MDAPIRPAIRCLVTFWSDPFGLVGRSFIVPLEEAVDYQRLGFFVLVDPQDQEDLVRWEQQQRSLHLWRRH